MINKIIIITIIFVLLVMELNNINEKYIGIDASGKLNNNVMASDLAKIYDGTIILWSSKENIPPGWLLCDGNHGTPDLRGRFIVGATTNDDDESFNLKINDPFDSKQNIKLDYWNDIIYKVNDKGGHNLPQLPEELFVPHNHTEHMIPGGNNANIWGNKDWPLNTTWKTVWNFKKYTPKERLESVLDGGLIKNTDSNHLLARQEEYGFDSGDNSSSSNYIQGYISGKNEQKPFDNRPKWYALFYIIKKSV